jgi:hypothetical protein
VTQFIEARFTHDAQRTYAYRNDGEPLEPGDFVKVEAKGGGWKTVEVARIRDDAPPFECKPVLEKAERPDSWPAPETAPLL